MKKILLFVLPILALCFCLEWMMRAIPNDYSTKANGLKQLGPNTACLFLGGSQGYMGFNADSCILPAFNLAHVSQSLDWDWALLQHYAPLLPNLKYVVLPITYPTLFNTLEESPETWRIKNYVVFHDLDAPHGNLTYHSLIMDQNFFELSKRGYLYFSEGKSESLCSENGTYRHPEPPKTWEFKGPIAAKRHTTPIHSSITDENIHRVEEMINWCSSKNIHLILVTTPAWHTYIEKLNEEQWEATQQYCQNWDRRNNHVTYVNWMTDTAFHYAHFQDADHCSALGAVLLTKKINALLK